MTSRELLIYPDPLRFASLWAQAKLQCPKPDTRYLRDKALERIMRPARSCELAIRPTLGQMERLSGLLSAAPMTLIHRDSRADLETEPLSIWALVVSATGRLYEIDWQIFTPTAGDQSKAGSSRK